MRKVWKPFMALFMAALLTAAFGACGAKEQPAEQTSQNELSVSEENAAASAETEMDILMEQVAEREMANNYAHVLPTVTLADAEVFGTDEDGGTVRAYVWLEEEEYVALKDKAYNMSGSAGEAIIHYTQTENGPELQEVEWSEDGSGHDEWVKEHFPEESYAKAQAFNPYDDPEADVPHNRIMKKAAELLGVPVETENLLTIDLENNTYEIIKTIESGTPGKDDYKFETETLESGSLSDLAD